ncbi:hypothetical protein ACXWOB_09640, partial [Streptococcus pyogenes]
DSRIYVEALADIKVGEHLVGPGRKYTHAWLPRGMVKRMTLRKQVKMVQPHKPPAQEAPVEETPATEADE